MYQIVTFRGAPDSSSGFGFRRFADFRDNTTSFDAMTPSLARTRPADAFTRGLDRLEALLTEKRITGHGDRNELPDRPIVDEDT